MLTDINNIWWEYTLLYFQQHHMQHVRLLFTEHCYFKF